MSVKREAAKAILARVPKGKGIQSDTDGQLFYDWTGITHKEMVDSWVKNINNKTLLTACNGFASKFAGLIGITGIASFFELEKSLMDVGKAHAWVPASSRLKPDVGDILRHTVYHVDVAAGWDGTKLVRVAAGQSLHSRPKTVKEVEKEFDCLKWVTGGGPYNPANLQGWLDLDLYFGAAPSVGPTLGWLHGWWKVWDGNTYFYYFGPRGDVQYTKTPPQNLGGPPKQAKNLGRYTFSANQVVVTWNPVAGVATACQETFYNAVPGSKQMNANSNLYGPLVATRLS